MTRRENIDTGGWSLESIEELITGACQIADAGERIAFISEQFLGIPYVEGTLGGDSESEEIFTINLGALDCFTFIDYVEALRLSDSFSSFRAALKSVRYQHAIIGFSKRNHFFSDWTEFNSEYVKDITAKLGCAETRKKLKVLNLREDGRPFVAGVRQSRREISYIPSSAITEELISHLKTGDYVGIYSAQKGLDVTHVGIFIAAAGGRPVYRHASSRQEIREVIDEDFASYFATKPGMVVLRPCDASFSLKR